MAEWRQEEGRAVQRRHCPRPPRRAVSSSQVNPRHTGLNAYGCCIPALTRFTPPRCMGPSFQHHLLAKDGRVQGASEGHSPCYGGLQVIHRNGIKEPPPPRSARPCLAVLPGATTLRRQECTTHRDGSQAARPEMLDRRATRAAPPGPVRTDGWLPRTRHGLRRAGVGSIMTSDEQEPKGPYAMGSGQ